METESTSIYCPKIVAFCCEQSGIPAAEMGKNLWSELSDNIEIIAVPCAGRIETFFLLQALEKGADGVLIFACHEENCQYLRGNIRAKSRLYYAQERLATIGLVKERLTICNLATNSGAKFVEVLKEKIEQLRELGPNPFSRKSNL